jgi:CheY-like chemotaxis protein
MPTKVLVFESDTAFAGELRTELGNLGCSTTVVDDGNVGLQQASSERPDLILLSIELPRMNGFSVCNKLKKDANLKEVPLIIMSSESSDETFEQHKKLRTRAEDYVHKPIAFGELLRHIREFVAIGSAPSEEGVIVIDDEIEVGAADYVVDEDKARGSKVPPERQEPTAKRAETVDADVDAFAESAFGRLTGPEAANSATEAGAAHNGSMTGERVVPPAPRKAVASTPTRSASVRPAPPPGVDAAEHEKLREELARAKERAGEAGLELDEARREIDKLRLEVGEADRLSREIEELKAKLAAGAKGGAVSSREFLDLREALNKKDKEILALKEQLSKKDKEIVESQDRALAMERGKGDLDDRLLVLERELAEWKDKGEALAADKDLAKKASEDFRARFEKAKGESETKERQLAELRAKHAEASSTSAAKLAAVRAEVDQTLANERAAHARAFDEVEDRRKADVDQARREAEKALADARDQAEGDKREALAGQAAQLTREADKRREAEVASARKEGDERFAQVRAEAERREQTALEGVRAEHAEKLRALEAGASRELGEANDKLGRLEVDLSGLRGELESLRESKTVGDAANEMKLSAANDRITALETQLTSLREEHVQAKDKLASESSRADRAIAKWEGDKQSLERAKDALAVALAQIEEAEGRV